MKNVLVTGATRGIGLAVSARLARDGFRVIGTSRGETAEFSELREGCDDGAVHFRPCDLDSPESVLHELVQAVVADHGPLFGLVNNAGIGLSGVLPTMHSTEIERVVRVNLLAPIHLSKYASRSMLIGGAGRIVNVASINAFTGFNGLSVYGASKAGLIGFTRSLARELGRAGITVNAVAPGYTETDMTATIDRGRLETIRRRSPLGLPRTEDVAGAVAYLIGPDAERVTGTVLTVDGGSTA